MICWEDNGIRLRHTITIGRLENLFADSWPRDLCYFDLHSSIHTTNTIQARILENDFSHVD